MKAKKLYWKKMLFFSKEFKVKVSAAYVAAQTWDFIKFNWVIVTAIITFFTGLFVRKKIIDTKKKRFRAIMHQINLGLTAVLNKKKICTRVRW